MTVLVSDFANNDAAGKLNVVGGTVAILGFDPMQGLSSRFTLSVVIRVPSHMLPAEFAIEVTLRSNGVPFLLPGPAEPQPLRIAQPITVEKPSAANVPVPAIRDHIGASHTLIFDFNTGLPLKPGGLYEWHIRIDGDEDTAHTYPFAVMGPPPAPVFG